MVCLLTFNPVVAHFGVVEATETLYSAEAQAGLERMWTLQGSLKGYGAQDSFANEGPRVADKGQEFIASLSKKDRGILSTPLGAKFLKEHSRLARTQQLKKKFDKCVTNKESKRKLDQQIVATIMNAPYTGGCDVNLTKENNRSGAIANSTLEDYISDMNRIQNVMNSGYVGDLTGLQDKLRLQSLKNSMASYLSHRYKYESGFINPETGVMNESQKTNAISALCKNEDGRNTCSTTMKKDLRKFVTNKAFEIAATQKKSTYGSAYRGLKSAYDRLNTKLRRVDFRTDYSGIDSADLEDPKAREAYTAYNQEYIKEVQGQDGLLMMSSVMKDKAGGFRTIEDHENTGSFSNKTYEMKNHDIEGFTVNDLKAAKKEIQDKIYDQAKQLNSMASEKDTEQKKWKDNGYKDSGLGWDKNEITSSRKDDIRKLIKTNPAAVGQVLMENPGYANIVCDAINSIDDEDKSDEKWDSVFMIGGLIVAGVMIIGGGACVLLSFGLCTPLAGASIAGGLTIGTAVTAGVLVAGGIEAAYWSKRTYENYNEYRDLENAVFTNNMDEEFGVEAVQEAYGAFKDARFNALMALPAVLLPGLGKLTSIGKGTKFAALLKGMGSGAKVKYMNTMTKFYNMLGKSPKLQKMVSALIKSGKLPAAKIHDFFAMLSQGKKGLNAKFLTWVSNKLDKIDDAKGLTAFQAKFQKIVQEGLEAAQKACKL